MNSTVVWRDWPAASMGMANRSWLSPMGRSPRADVVGVRPGLSTHTSTFTVSDTVTRLLDAFPKNASATCPMSKAPNSVEEDQLKELGIGVLKDE